MESVLPPAPFISGLACGYLLRRAGHDVTILEKSDGKSKTGGSIRSPPNMTRILNEWPGMDALLKSRATGCSGYAFRRADTLERVGFMKFHEEILSELRAEFLVVQHSDLCTHLKALCLGAGAAVDIIKAQGSSSATVVLEDGSSLSGDIVIGADGHNSIVRAILARDAEEDLECEHTVLGVNVVVPTEVVEQDPELQSLGDHKELTIWMGSGSIVFGALDKNAQKFNFSIHSPQSLDMSHSDWDEIGAKKILLPFDLSSYDPRLHKLINMGTTCYPTLHHLYVQDDIWGLDQTVVLVGDAAHSAFIHGNHNSAMAIEDAAILGRLFSRISTRSQIPMLLSAYQDIRYPRTKATQESEYQALLQMTIPFGPATEGRDAGLKASLTMGFEDLQNLNAAGSDNMLMQIWEQYLKLFSYNAAEAVDDWWSMWGYIVNEDGLTDDLRNVPI
ncbi:hypothetical protein B0H14DRAFT_2943251 [Mycena olivaceomarginata]|nr:hypothetical protein B0H14DRAFT_2943251 [Mycena olivaceomarginata]